MLLVLLQLLLLGLLCSRVDELVSDELEHS